MKFILQKERQESEWRIIESEGIAKAQEIINRTLTSAYLQHEAIQAQRKWLIVLIIQQFIFHRGITVFLW